MNANWRYDNTAFWRAEAALLPTGFWAWVCGFGKLKRCYLRVARVWEIG